MGIWRGVYLKVSGKVSLDNTNVQSKVKLPGLEEASLTIKTRLRNYSSETVNGILKGKIENSEFSYLVTLKPGIVTDLKLTAEQIPELRLMNPRIGGVITWAPLNYTNLISHLLQIRTFQIQIK